LMLTPFRKANSEKAGITYLDALPQGCGQSIGRRTESHESDPVQLTNHTSKLPIKLRKNTRPNGAGHCISLALSLFGFNRNLPAHSPNYNLTTMPFFKYF